MSKVIRCSLFIIGLVLSLQCLALMLMDKINFGTVVPLFIGLVFIAHAIYWHKILDSLSKNRRLKRLCGALWAGFALWLVSFMLFVMSLVSQIQQNQSYIAQSSANNTLPKLAAIVVLGSGTNDGKPTKTLALRLDTAAKLYQHQPQALLITSGGLSIGHSQSEADIMATYLEDTHQVAAKQILTEAHSTSTAENLAYSKAILAKHGVAVAQPNTPIAIVTSDFHTIRAAAIARRQGYALPITIASPTPLSIRYNAWFREYFAFVSGWLFNEY